MQIGMQYSDDICTHAATEYKWNTILYSLWKYSKATTESLFQVVSHRLCILYATFGMPWGFLLLSGVIFWDVRLRLTSCRTRWLPFTWQYALPLVCWRFVSRILRWLYGRILSIRTKMALELDQSTLYYGLNCWLLYSKYIMDQTGPQTRRTPPTLVS